MHYDYDKKQDTNSVLKSSEWVTGEKPGPGSGQPGAWTTGGLGDRWGWQPGVWAEPLHFLELYTNFSLTFSGKVPSPICGQTVILAEKYEENTYTLIEPSTDQQNISPVKNGKKQPKDIETNLTSKQCGISCESKNFRELSPTAEPFIPEKVK